MLRHYFIWNKSIPALRTFADSAVVSELKKPHKSFRHRKIQAKHCSLQGQPNKRWDDQIREGRQREEMEGGSRCRYPWLDVKRIEMEEKRMVEDEESKEDEKRFWELERRLAEMWLEHGEKLEQDEQEMLGSDRIRDPASEPDISEMETGEETSSRLINQFRQILYTDGELDDSDLSIPPSRQNPHPFDPSTVPPTHSRTLTVYANHLPVLQMLLELGVNLFEVEQMPKIGRMLARLDLEREVKPKIYWLAKRVGVPTTELGSYLTRNPFFLLQTLDDLKARLEYLQYRRFSRNQIAKMVVEYRYWLNMPHEQIDARLGWIVRQFRLRPDELRAVMVKEPRVIQFGVGPIQGVILALNKTCGFSHRDLQQILLRDPRVFLMDKTVLMISYNYLAYVMRIPNEQIVGCPAALRCPLWALRRRHEFLFRLRKANYTPNTPENISLEKFIAKSDKYFAEEIARTPIADYNRFIKLM